MTNHNANINFTVYSHRFQEWTGTDWFLEKYKDKICKIDEYNSELSIKHFDEELLAVIVDDYISELSDSKSQYERTSFDAGFQITLNGKRIDYNCCGEFCKYINWESILTNKKSIWTELWIGHPWIYYKMEYF